MNSGIVELAKMLKERDNKPFIGIGIGRVVSPWPDIKIQFGEHIVLLPEDLVFAARLADESTGAVTLEASDEVMLIPTPDNEQWFVIDKAVR